MEKESNHKVLILKTGHSEVLENNPLSEKPSFGDILRTTPLLHLYKDDHVIWLTDKSAFPLLKGNPYINELLSLDFKNAVRLMHEKDIDTIINLEKNYDICKLVNKISAWRKYGFRFDEKTNSAQAYDRAFEILSVGADIEIQKTNEKIVQELLFEIVGEKWRDEEYVLGYKPKSEIKYDIGLNIFVGSKWSMKMWPMNNWDKLEKDLLKNNLKITRQDKQSKEILSDLYSYMDWINSCKMIVSNDSLGMHLAIALKKKVLGLFGPTAHREVHFYSRGKAILPQQTFSCFPCFRNHCIRNSNCIKDITPEMVYNEVMNLINKN